MIWEIAKREIVTRVQTRAFQVLSGLMFVGVFAVAILVPTLTTGGAGEAEEVTIGVTAEGAAYSAALSVGTEELDITVIETSDGETLIESGEIDVLFTGDELVWESFSPGDIDLFIRTTVQQAEFSGRAENLGLGNEELGTLFAETPIDERFLDGEDDEQLVRLAAAGASTFATFMLLQVWGGFLMMGVVEEKSSRVVEVLLSHISARTLLSGKILGLGVLAVAQLFIIVAGIVIGLLMVQDIEIPSGVWGSVPVLATTFILGFAFYASLFAAVGSTVSRQEDAQAAALPPMLPLLVGYLIAASSVGNADSMVVTIASLVPFTSPIVLPFRVATANPPIWQVLLSLGLLAASVPFVIRIAGQIYRGTLLNVGTRVPITQAFRNRNAM